MEGTGTPSSSSSSSSTSSSSSSNNGEGATKKVTAVVKPPRPCPLNVVFVGLRDHGKSTIVGALAGRTQPQRWHELIKRHRSDMGRVGPYQAWCVDKLKVERERGITIDGNVVQYFPGGGSRAVALLDPPGVSAFTPRMVTMICQGDAAVVVVSASDIGDREMTLSQRFGELCSYVFVFRIKYVTVVINKMDLVNYEEATFERIKEKALRCLKVIGYGPNKIIAVIPTTGQTTEGENLVKLATDKMPWYKGLTLDDALLRCKTSGRKVDGPPLINILKAYKIGGVGTVVTGCVMRGIVRLGQPLMFVPGCEVVVPRSMELWHTNISEAVPGEFIGFNVRNVSVAAFKKGWKGFLVGLREPGAALSQADKEAIDAAMSKGFSFLHPSIYYPSDPRLEELFAIPCFTKGFTADVWLSRAVLGKRRKPFGRGVAVALRARLSSSNCRVLAVKARIDEKTHEILERYPRKTVAKQLYSVEFVLHDAVCVEPFSKFPPMSRIVLSDSLGLIGAGLVRETIRQKKLRIVSLSDSNQFFDAGLKSMISEKFRGKFHHSGGMRQFSLKNTNLLCVNDDQLPMDSVSPKNLKAIDAFVRGGGSALIVVTRVTDKINALLDVFGLQVTAATVASGSSFSSMECVPLQLPQERLVQQEHLRAQTERARAEAAAYRAKWETSKGKQQTPSSASSSSSSSSSASSSSRETMSLKAWRLQKMNKEKAIRESLTYRKPMNRNQLAAARMRAKSNQRTSASRTTRSSSPSTSSPTASTAASACEISRASIAVMDEDAVSIEDLPEEVLFQIFAMLKDAVDLCSVGSVCRVWDAVSCDETLWRPLCLRDGISSFYSMIDERWAKKSKDYYHNSTEKKDEGRNEEGDDEDGSRGNMEYKHDYVMYGKAAIEGKTLVRGPFGKVRLWSCGFATRIAVEEKRKLGGRKEGVLDLALMRKPLGGGAVLVHMPRFVAVGRGQVVVLVNQDGHALNPRSWREHGNREFLLNLFHDASMQAYKPSKP